MKKKVLAIILSVTLCTMMAQTALAASSTTSGSSSTTGGSGSQTSAVAEAPATRGTENTDKVAVGIKNADGTVSTVNMTQYTERNNTAVISAAAEAANPGEAVSAMMTTPASDVFKEIGRAHV